MEKGLYIDLLEKVLTSYSDERIREFTAKVKKNGLEEHGYPRLTINLGILIAHGRKTEYKDMFLEMMDLCCDEIPTARLRNGGNVGAEFSVIEMVRGIIEIENSGVFEKSVTDGWREKLAKINPYETYTMIAPTPPVRLHNWALFVAVSEQLRKYAGIGDESTFIENQIASQMFSFDENGMYRDPPDDPITYDIVARLQFAVILYYGYNGKYLKDLEEYLLKSADITLKMQSVTGEIPFCGRSSQFLHNEAVFAALCEFYAVFFKKRGDIKKAGMFKRAAAVAIKSIVPWLNEKTIHHIKNYHPVDSMYGCEFYAYFDKYMVTAGSMLYLAYTMADDSIEEVPCNAESENYICETSKHFHKVFCKYEDYFIEIETNADEHHNATGLGRVHKKGVPSALCMSAPCPRHPAAYTVDIDCNSPLSICGGIKLNDEYLYSCDGKVEYRLKDKKNGENSKTISFDCIIEEKVLYTESYSISPEGVLVTVEGNGELEILFPVFDFDGETKTIIDITEKNVNVSYKGYTCCYSGSGFVENKDCMCANRNGHYQKMAVKGKNKVSLKIELKSAE